MLASLLSVSKGFRTVLCKRPVAPQRNYALQSYPSQALGQPSVDAFLEPNTSTWQYVVHDPVSKDAALIDTVLDYNAASGQISTKAADAILSFVKDQGLHVKYILETHAHADHLSAAQYHKKMLNAPVAIGCRIGQVQSTFASRYGFTHPYLEGSFDILLQDDATFDLGSLVCKVVHLPGHTPDHIGYVIGEAIFTGDSIFQPDVGSARVDFPGGDAKALFSTIRRLLAFPPSYRLFVGHDYPADRPHQCASTVEEQRRLNKHANDKVSEAQFTEFRTARDRVLGAPTLLHPSLQTNIRAGKLPYSDASPLHFKIPVTSPVDI